LSGTISLGKFKKESLIRYLYRKKLLKTMINSYLKEIILNNFPYAPTADQLKALETLCGFLLAAPGQDTLLLLRGYAGTGKTALVGALVKALGSLKQKTVLLAPTGRAAKVFSLYAGQRAFTIHRKIYRLKGFSAGPADFVPVANPHSDTIFIVDEASMIAGETSGAYAPGSRGLLDDLLHYVYCGRNCRLILMGDEAQLPPVGLEESPALKPEALCEYFPEIQQILLTQVVRQSGDSDILLNATALREALERRATGGFPRLRLRGLPDMRQISGNELLDELPEAYGRDGIDETVVIVRSNKQAKRYNNGIRSRVLCLDGELAGGDRLMVAKNNYRQAAGCEGMDFIANGDSLQVLRVRKETERYGLRFAELSVRFDDYGLEMDLTVILDTLQTETPALSQEHTEALFNALQDDYAHLRTRAERMKTIKADPYYNAVQVKYAYALTCHKAQGGQWKNVFLDMGYLPGDAPGDTFYRWLYTAITRAGNRLYLVNPPARCLEI
jgi:exodeoxyribonuclease-5